MLLKKEGITRLQIPNSMIKAPKGTGSDEVAVVFNNVFPSEPNSKLARFLDTELKPPSPGYIKEDQVKLSLMYQRMFLGYGVPEHVVLAYVKRAIKVDGMMHTHLIGVADPVSRKHSQTRQSLSLFDSQPVCSVAQSSKDSKDTRRDGVYIRLDERQQ